MLVSAGFVVYAETRRHSENAILHGEAHGEGPEASHLVGLDSLPESLAVLGIFTLEGIGHQVLVDEDLRVESILLFELLDLDIVVFGLDPGRRHLVVCQWLVSRCCVCAVSMVWRKEGGTVGGELGRHNRGSDGLCAWGYIAVSVHVVGVRTSAASRDNQPANAPTSRQPSAS